MRSFKENKKDINRFILQQKEGNRLKPRTVKKGFLGVMGLFLLSALTPALIPFAVDKTAILHRSDMRRGRCFGSVFCSGSQHICFWRERRSL